MDPVIVAISIMMLQKVFEKTGEMLGEKVMEQSAKLLSSLRQKSPETVSDIESYPDKAPNYGRAVLAIEALANSDPEVAEAVRDLAVAAVEDPDAKLYEPLKELVSNLSYQEQTDQIGVKLAEKIGLVIQGSFSSRKDTINLRKGYDKYRFQWDVVIRFSGETFRAAAIFQFLFLLSEVLESISGVSVEIESQGTGSLWTKLKIFMKDAFQKEEVKEVLEKTRDAVIAEQLDKRIEGVKKLEEETLKTRAERISLERQSESLPDTEEAKKLRELEIKRKELEIREKTVDIERKEIENQQKKLELYEKVAYMMREGMLNSSPMEIQINGLPFLSCNDKKILPGSSMDAIDQEGTDQPDININDFNF
ncbi:hypothetical protein IQ265_23720 [Nodosilinea sp. LEGE 06152]|uniref:hypothetical protein n=1 Tax=Nodosilinea sp. LEGE 06152 TaxID=2777966 RepID=UPI001880F370|nr:hypothetical protein [Nodosilinea sp. LEGE 06152]MBE9159819.1 hypothetical protein [Nodosilinea sp. LEGE 06152]